MTLHHSASALASAIVTLPPYAPFLDELVRHPIVSGFRLNTVMPVKEPLEVLLKRLKLAIHAKGKDLWIDLKTRQLRVVGYAVPPFTEIRVSHPVTVDTPTTVYFGNGLESAELVGVDGDRLLLLDGPRRVVGPGESINIIAPEVEVEGFFTQTDLEYIEAAKKVGIHKFMLSFIEGHEDIEALLALDPRAEVVAKIESQKGLDFVNHEYNGHPRLMAACGDLYIEVERPHHVTKAIEDIVAKDPGAILASRIFPSLAESLAPAFQDILAVNYGLQIGYRAFMFGDEICLRRDSIIGGLNLLQAIIEAFDQGHAGNNCK